MIECLHLFISGAVVRRGLKYAVIVGAILVSINHGDAIIAGSVSQGQYVKMGLTVLVPYCVSTFSSVAAILDTRGAGDATAKTATPTSA